MRARFVDHLRQHSIRFNMLLAFFLMVVGVLAVDLTTILSTQNFLKEYHIIASRVADANALVPITQVEIGKEAYYLVTGRHTLQDTPLYTKLLNVQDTIDRLSQLDNTEESGRQLYITSRTLKTLEKYCIALRENNSKPIDEQNVILEQTREVSSLVAEQINEYIYLELSRMDKLDEQIQKDSRRMMLIGLASAALVVFSMALVQLLIDRSISRPIEKLVENTRRLSEGDFGVRVESRDKNEITVLGESFNRMVKKLEQLMEKQRKDARTREQLELRLLQEQINPHFLYNTLETIIWLSEESDREQVIEVVKSLSRFFRVVLSQGRETITIREELDCIRNYLYIQHVRFSDVMTYSIEADETVLNCAIQKLTLQPLVENALYHGIEHKRGGGTIRVSVKRKGDLIEATVADNGCGISSDKLAALQRSIEEKSSTGGGFGLSNVQKRIQLAYGMNCGLSITSREGEGTSVTLRLPSLSETAWYEVNTVAP